MNFTDHVILACILWALAIAHNYFLEKKISQKTKRRIFDRAAEFSSDLKSDFENSRQDQAFSKSS